MRIAITGGSGQLGTVLIQRLLADAGVESIVCIDARAPLVANRRITAVSIDVRDPGLRAHLEGCDAVVHMAFLLAAYRSRSTYASVNVSGSANVLRQAIAAGVGHFVFLSSAAVYGVFPARELPLNEDSPRVPQPGFPYAHGKQSVEDALDEAERRPDGPVVTRVRPAMVLGASMDNAMGWMLARRRLPAVDTPLQFVWDEDVADAVARILERRPSGAFNLGAESPRSGRELAAALGLRTIPPPPRWAAGAAGLATLALERLGLAPSIHPSWFTHARSGVVVSSARARDELGWAPKHATVLDVLRRFERSATRKADRRIRRFFSAANLAGRLGPHLRELRKVRLRTRLRLTGAGGGDFAVVVDEGRVVVHKRPPRPPDATVTMPATFFVDLLRGRANWSVGQLTGTIAADGQAMGTMVLSAMVTTYRSRIKQSGLRGRANRLVDSWIMGSSA